MASRFTNVVGPRPRRFAGNIKDHNVNRLVQAWMGHSPANFDMSFEKFLLIPSREVQRFGAEFTRKHQELIKRILIRYAESVNTINVMTEDTPDQSLHHPGLHNNQSLGTGHGPFHVDDDRDDDDHDDDDDERLYAQEFDSHSDLSAYIMGLKLKEGLK